MQFEELAKELEPYRVTGDLDSCLEHTELVIRKLPKSPYKKVLEVDFNNSPEEIAEILERFIKEANKVISLKAVCVVINQFVANSNEWFFNIDGYIQKGDRDYSWIGHSDFDLDWSHTLTGMESLQSTYEEISGDCDYVQAFASLLVVLKFQRLVRSGVNLLNGYDLTVVAASTDDDFIFGFEV